MVEAARKYQRIAQAGTQRRSSGRYRKAIQLLREGVIGELYLAHWIFTGPRPTIGFHKPEPPPPSVHWDLWLGPAPQQPFRRNLLRHDWHWYWDFGNGDLANNGVHFMDIACWGLNKGLPSRAVCTGGRFGYRDEGQVPNTYNCLFEYADGSQLTCEVRGLATNEETRVDFFGTKGNMRVDAAGRYQVFLERRPTPEPDMGKLEDEDHFRNFIAAMRTGNRETLRSEIEEAEAPTVHCHLANISWRLKRELRFNPQTRRFLGDAEADGLLTRKYRHPFVLPEKV
jgi:predicted dehydrogenase